MLLHHHCVRVSSPSRARLLCYRSAVRSSSAEMRVWVRATVGGLELVQLAAPRVLEGVQVEGSVTPYGVVALGVEAHQVRPVALTRIALYSISLGVGVRVEGGVGGTSGSDYPLRMRRREVFLKSHPTSRGEGRTHPPSQNSPFPRPCCSEGINSVTRSEQGRCA